MPTVTESEFERFLGKKMGKNWHRALHVFKDYAPNMCWDVTNVLLYAADQGKVVEVLEILEKHFRDHLQREHPDARGRINPSRTAVMFRSLCETTLGLKPN